VIAIINLSAGIIKGTGIVFPSNFQHHKNTMIGKVTTAVGWRFVFGLR
jgi:hypothetical protein